MNKTTVALIIILLFSLGMRLGALFTVYHADPLRITAPDTISYENPALALLKTGKFSKSPMKPNDPEVMRTPGYPLLIALTYRVFGQSRPILVIIQILISVATIALLYVLASFWFGKRVALLAAMLLAIDPASSLSSQLMLAETSFALFFLLAAIAGTWLLCQGEHKLCWAFLLGLALAIATQIRPIAVYLIYPVLIGTALVERRKGSSWRELFSLIMLILIPWVLVVCGWQVRNWRVTGKPEFTYLKNYNLLMNMGGHIVEMRDHITLAQAHDLIEKQLPDTTGWPVTKIDQLYHDRAVALIKANPQLVAKVHVVGFINVLLGPASRSIREYLGMNQEFSPFRDFRASPGQFLRKLFVYPGVTLIFFSELIFMIIVNIGIVVSIWPMIRSQKALWPLHLFLVGLILYMLILSAGSQTTYRFRVPISPLLLLYSALGLSVLWDGITKRWSGHSIQ